MDEIEQLKAKEKEQEEMGYNSPAGVEDVGRSSGRRRQGTSLYGPVFMIGLGVYFLLTNMGVIDGELDWGMLARWWPLFFIFAGLNVLVRSVRGPAGSALSGLVGLAAVLTFGGLLMFGDLLPFLNSNSTTSPQYLFQQIEIDRQEASQAEVELEFSEANVVLKGLNDSPLLLSGSVVHQGNLFIEDELRGDTLELVLDVEEDDQINITSSLRSPAAWELSLNDQIPMSLELFLDSGRAELDLRDLTLMELTINGSSGPMEVWLPAGEYKTHLYAKSGNVDLHLPDKAISNTILEVEGGSGVLNLSIPASLPVKMELEEEVGRRLSSEDFHYEAEHGWVTNNFDPNLPYLELDIDVSTGPVRIEIE